MTGSHELPEDAKQDCGAAVSRVLADTFVLYLKTHNFHWNVEGPKFRSLHELFEEQYTALWKSLDDIAERIRALGVHAPGTRSAFDRLARVHDSESVAAADDMLREIAADHETVASTIRSALTTVQQAGDEASAGLLGDRLAYHEKQLWMMKSMLA